MKPMHQKTRRDEIIGGTHFGNVFKDGDYFRVEVGTRMDSGKISHFPWDGKLYDLLTAIDTVNDHWALRDDVPCVA